MKVYTKTGDEGLTSLVGGARVPKNDVRVEAYGTVDELISFIGLLRAQPVTLAQDEALLHIEQDLMTVAAHLANGGSNKKLPELTDERIRFLETNIDAMSAGLPPLRAFVLPAPPAAAALCHVARSVCRRAERAATTVNQQTAVPTNVMVYLNRLSDYLFTLSRQVTVDANRKEEFWLS
ncbi:MAG: cob(I)yrinic acid a,c-diamide adenosyltransferase [Prevotellaceae bacterium]|jgi:cob(I)alamin adenosyltransferase|nr:cob(I)yrinic acid a,c-diamide adenosyltransferase [Prevotellaceae bacterium]